MQVQWQCTVSIQDNNTVLILEKHQYIIHNQRTKDFQIKSFVLFFIFSKLKLYTLLRTIHYHQSRYLLPTFPA